MNNKILYFLIFILVGCSSQEQKKSSWVEMTGRGSPREKIYRARVPKTWKCLHPSADESLLDTRKALCEYWIEDGLIKITIHNFPTDRIEQRIPPEAQINRWLGQLSNLDKVQTNIQPWSVGGFRGLYLSATNEEMMVLGWAMQLGPEHYRQLDNQQMKADYTIKAIGSPSVVKKHKSEIENFANSFELIEEIPSDL